MVTFIEKEAREKAEEIRTNTEEEFTIEKSKLVTTHKQKITQEYERKMKEVEVSKKIARSNLLSDSRLQILKAREAGVARIIDTARQRLEDLSKSDKYQELLVNLILQCFNRLEETDLELRARDEDRHLVEKAIPIACDIFLKKTGKKVKVVLDTKHPLPPSRALAGAKALSTCAGGVILCTKGNRILCNNTLDVRLQLAFEATVPALRAKLFKTEVV